MKKLSVIAMLAAVMLVAGCATKTTYVGPQDNVAVLSLDYRDFEKAASEAANDIIASPMLMRKNTLDTSRYIISVGPIINDTTQRIDTDQLTKKIRVKMLQSGRFIVTTAIGIAGAEDKMTQKIRDMDKNPIVDKSTLKRKDGVRLPDFNLSGKIIQRNHKVSRRTQQLDYYFQLTLTNLEDGLAYWEGEYPIIKRGSNKSVPW